MKKTIAVLLLILPLMLIAEVNVSGRRRSDQDTLAAFAKKRIEVIDTARFHHSAQFDSASAVRLRSQSPGFPWFELRANRHNTQTGDQVMQISQNAPWNYGTSQFSAREISGKPAMYMNWESDFDNAAEWNLNYAPPGTGTPVFQRVMHMNYYNRSSTYGRDTGDVNWRFWTKRYGGFAIGFDAGGPTNQTGGNEDPLSMAFTQSGADVRFSIRNYRENGTTTIQLIDTNYNYLQLRRHNERADSMYGTPLRYASEVSSVGYGALLLGTLSDNDVVIGRNNQRIARYGDGGLQLYKPALYIEAPSPEITLVNSTDASQQIKLKFLSGKANLVSAYGIRLSPSNDSTTGKVEIGNIEADSMLSVNGGGHYKGGLKIDGNISAGNFNGTHLTIDTVSINSLLESNGGARFLGTVNASALGFDRLDVGVQDGTPRIIFEDAGSAIWGADNSGGTFRLWGAGAEQFNLSTTQLELKNQNLIVGGTGSSTFAGTVSATDLRISGTSIFGRSNTWSQDQTFSGNAFIGGSVVVGSSGAYQSGSIYSNSDWGMIFRAKQVSPTTADFMFAASDGTERARITSTGMQFVGNISVGGTITSTSTTYVRGTDGLLYHYTGSAWVTL